MQNYHKIMFLDKIKFWKNTPDIALLVYEKWT